MKIIPRPCFRSLRKPLVLVLVLVLASIFSLRAADRPLRIGSKKFTESYVLGEIAKGALKDLMPLRDEHKAARTKALELLSAGTIDRAAIEQVRTAELKLAETASRRVTQAIADAAEVLQPAQRAKLAEKMKQRMEHHG